jgi:hypothetical protein
MFDELPAGSPAGVSTMMTRVHRTEEPSIKLEVMVDSKLLEALDRWRSASQGPVTRPEAASFMLNAMLQIFTAPVPKQHR